MANDPGRLDGVHIIARLLIIGAALAVGVTLTGCGSESGSDAADTEPTTTVPAPTSSVDDTALPNDSRLLGEWSVASASDGSTTPNGLDGGFVVFDTLDERLTVSIGQAGCFVDGGFADVRSDVVTMERIGEQTPGDCPDGPLLDEVVSLISCLEGGCTIEVATTDVVTLRAAAQADLSITLVRADLDL